MSINLLPWELNDLKLYVYLMYLLSLIFAHTAFLLCTEVKSPEYQDSASVNPFYNHTSVNVPQDLRLSSPATRKYIQYCSCQATLVCCHLHWWYKPCHSTVLEACDVLCCTDLAELADHGCYLVMVWQAVISWTWCSPRLCPLIACDIPSSNLPLKKNVLKIHC